MPNRKRKAAVEWDKVNRRTVGTQVSVREAEEIKSFAEKHGETVSAMVKRLIREEMKGDSARHGDHDGNRRK